MHQTDEWCRTCYHKPQARVWSQQMSHWAAIDKQNQIFLLSGHCKWQRQEIRMETKISVALIITMTSYILISFWPVPRAQLHAFTISFLVQIFLHEHDDMFLCLWDVVIWNVGSMTESITISRTSSRQQERDWHDLDIGHPVIDVKFWLGMFTLVNIHWCFYNFIVTVVWPNVTLS